MPSNAPIGVFDSGVGGLSVLREIHGLLPGESLLYAADCAHIPYGEKDPAFIRERCQQVAEFFLEKGAKAMVLACNTATVAAVNDLRECHAQWPIVGMEPAVKPAAAATKSGVVGVLATTGTLQSARFAALLDRFASTVKVVTQPCPGLVERVEIGDLTGPLTRALLKGYVAPLLAAGCDTIILGCTHYPFLKPLLRELLPAEVTLIDTGSAVARRLSSLIYEKDQMATDTPLECRFWTSGDVEQFSTVLPILWGKVASVETLPF